MMPCDWIGIVTIRSDNLVQHVDERDDQPQPRFPRAAQAAQPEQHAALVLPDDPHRECEHDQQQYCHDDDDDDQSFITLLPPGWVRLQERANRL